MVVTHEKDLIFETSLEKGQTQFNSVVFVSWPFWFSSMDGTSSGRLAQNFQPATKNFWGLGGCDQKNKGVFKCKGGSRKIS